MLVQTLVHRTLVIVGETASTITIDPARDTADGYLYRVEITDQNTICGPITSNAARLNVAPDKPHVIDAEGDQNYCPGFSVPVAESISITDPDDTSTAAAYIQISSGYVQGEDLLTLTGTHPNITPSFEPITGEITLSGPATYAEFEAAILAVEYSSSAAAPTGQRQFSITVGQANYLPATGHYYQYVPNDGISWTDANAIANNSFYFGLQGYLATLTSQVEADFSGTQTTGVGWIGATDNAVEGEWRWVTGPEAGTLFWNGAANGTEITFAYWNTDEPNDFDRGAAGAPGDENYAHIADPSVSGPTGRPGSWNDLPNAGDFAPYDPQGYVVEYGGMPGDPELFLSDVTTITMVTPASITSQPIDQTVNDGANVSFSANASGTNVTYQWQVSTDGGTSFSNISGETSASYTFTAELNDNENRYRVVVNDGSNACLEAISSAALLRVNVRSVITNRRITHRVNKD